MTIPTQTNLNETTRETFERWLSDGETWIGVFENHDLGHPDIGRRIAIPYDNSHLPAAKLGESRAPDHRSIGLGWRYLLVAICTDVDTALAAIKGDDHA